MIPLRSVRAFLVAGLAALSPALLAAQRPELASATKAYVTVDSAVIAITDVLVIDGTGGAAKPGQTVVIANGVITQVGPAKKVKVPTGAAMVDGKGKTLIPGIIGMHDHMYYSAAGGRSAQMSYTGPRLYLGAGVTTVRTTGSQSPYGDINLKHRIDQGQVPGPRIYVTTPYLTGPGGGGTMSVAETPEQARRFVAYWAEEGATWIKFYTNISREAMGAAIDEAHKQGMKATGHLCSVTFREAVGAPHRRPGARRHDGHRLHRGEGAGQVPAEFARLHRSCRCGRRADRDAADPLHDREQGLDDHHAGGV